MLIYGYLDTQEQIRINGFTYSLKKIHLKMSSAICQPYFLSLDVLIHRGREKKTTDILQMTFLNTLF